MPTRLLRDPVYLCATLLVAVVVIASFVLRPWVDGEILRIRPISAVLGLLVVLGLLFRARGRLRPGKIFIGLVVTAACGWQLVTFVAGGNVGSGDGSQLVAQNFAIGMFCLGMALVIDGVLPSNWGRHLVFGLLGAIAAGLGAFGLFEFVGLRHGIGLAAQDVVSGMRLPSALILFFGGIALLSGARLRGPEFEGDVTRLTGTLPVRDRTGLVAGLAMLFVTLAATALVWRETIAQARSQERLRVEEALGRFDTALSARALGAVALLDGVRGLFAASNDVTSAEWRGYLEHVRLQESYPGVVAVMYARDLLPKDIDVETPSLQIDGVRHPIRPPGRRDRFVVVTHVTPDNEILRRLIGLDVGVDGNYRAIFDAVRGGEAVGVSTPIDFARHGDPRNRNGFAVVSRASDARRIGEGFVYAVVDMASIVEQAYRDSGSNFLDVRVTDVTTDKDGMLLHRTGDFVGIVPAHASTIDIGGRRWRVDAWVRAAHAGAAASRNSMLVLVTGSIAALVLFAITWVLAGHRARALDLASRMTLELRRSQRAQRAITDTANAGIITADSAGLILYMNPAASTIFGAAPDELVGHALTDLVPERHRDRHLLGIERARIGLSPNIVGRSVESIGLRRDGAEFPVEVLASAWSSDGRTYFTGFVRDISARKQQEQMLLQKTRELERSNAELEQFAYVASHDLQEPLRMVASYVQLLARRYRGRLDQDADEFIGFAVDGASRMQLLIQDLLAYARVGRSGKQPIPVHLGHCAQEACSALQEAFVESGARIEIKAEGMAVAVPSQLVQLFQNLIGNAIKFRGKDVPSIAIDAQLEDRHWHVRVHDNGIGIEPQHRERVFAIFQRLHTRREYPGTGIGLAICRKIVEGFGGRIWVEAEHGQGSVFHFTVPVSEDAA